MADTQGEIVYLSHSGQEIDDAIYAIGGLAFVKLTREQYDALVAKQDKTVYYVVESTGAITQYMGEVQISGGGGVSSLFVSGTRALDSFNASRFESGHDFEEVGND